MQILYRQLQQKHRELQDVNLQLDEANKLKSNFLGLVSHELRSPFVSIDLALQAFPRYGLENLTSDQRELIAQVGHGFTEARQMIDRLVGYATLLSKQGQLHLETINIATLINETVTLLRPMAQRRQVSFQVDVPESLTLPAGDRERIGEALWHLLHNAIKFSRPRGEVSVRAYIQPEYLVFEVEDTGVGIPLDQQARIWEPYAQLSDPLKRGVEGLGLGLAMVRYVAAAHGGKVILHSQPDVGSVVGFWLPLSPHDEAS